QHLVEEVTLGRDQLQPDIVARMNGLEPVVQVARDEPLTMLMPGVEEGDRPRAEMALLGELLQVLARVLHRLVASLELGFLLAPLLGLAMMTNAEPADHGRQGQALADQGDDDDAERGE